MKYRIKSPETGIGLKLKVKIFISIAFRINKVLSFRRTLLHILENIHNFLNSLRTYHFRVFHKTFREQWIKQWTFNSFYLWCRLKHDFLLIVPHGKRISNFSIMIFDPIQMHNLVIFQNTLAHLCRIYLFDCTQCLWVEDQWCEETLERDIVWQSVDELGHKSHFHFISFQILHDYLVSIRSESFLVILIHQDFTWLKLRK